MYNRRRFITALGAPALALPAALKMHEADAIVSWCRSDPLFQVDDNLVDVTVASDIAMLIQASGPVRLVLTVPSTSSVTLLFADRGFGYGYDISYETSPSFGKSSKGPRISAAVYAPATRDVLPVRVYYSTLTLDNKLLFRSTTVDGESNAWITAS